MRSRKDLGQGPPGRDPPRVVEVSTDRLEVRPRDPCHGPDGSSLRQLHEALNEPWSNPRAVEWPVEACLGTRRQWTAKTNSTSLSTARGDLHEPSRAPWRQGLRTRTKCRSTSPSTDRGALHGPFGRPSRGPDPNFIKGIPVFFHLFSTNPSTFGISFEP